MASCRAFYLLAIVFYATKVSSPDDMGRADAQNVRANIRHYIDQKLRRETDDARRESRPFLDIMEEVEEVLKSNTDGVKDEFYGSSTLSEEVNRKTVEAYCAQLRSNFGIRA
jgi:hypothetical protein